MADLVKAEIKSVRDLKHGVTRYTEELRAAVSGIRCEVTTVTRQTDDAIEQRRIRLRQAEAGLRSVEDALSRCAPDQRHECEDAVRKALQQASVARQRLGAAAAAERQAASAIHDLSRVVGFVVAAVADQSSAATSALLELEVKLSEITTGRAAAVAKGALITFGIAAQLVGTTVDVAKLAGNVSQGALPTAEKITSTSQLQEWAADRDESAWAEVELDSRKRVAGLVAEGDEIQ